ncbi:Peptide methionine sulfoxide reductase [Lecanicillium sp. MT-2017a]|nr:Peptide methionine sulfoxide reductase [Lecanicillium sp. MT-2017a]
MPLLPNFITRFTRPLSRMATVATENTVPEGAQLCTVAAGCFWGTEHVYRKRFAGKGLLDAKVGYIGGDLSNPTYRAVCGGKTGHAEAAQIVFDPKQVSYRELLEFFYRMHDPTTLNAQGPDTGPQYRSAIYYHDADQEAVARDVTAKANAQWWKGGIVTEVAPAGKWYSAEEYHQLYLERNPAGYECPSHFIRSFKDLE